MNVDWSAYKITLLLYLGVLFFPISFYFSYENLTEIQSDTSMINKFSLHSASMLLLDKNTKQKSIDIIDESFDKLKPWVLANDKQKFYVATQSLSLEYNAFIETWKKTKKTNHEELKTCYKKANAIVFSLNNMIKLKQNRVYNILYINIFISVGLFMTLVFFTRAYIHKQLSKHAIYDFESKLFSKEYLLVTLKEISARMKRNKESLSTLYINVHDLKDDKRNTKIEKEKIVTQVGKALLETLRESDVACRYSNGGFIAILPNTELKNVETITRRLDNYLNNLSYTTKSVQYKENETYEEFMLRIFE